MSIETAQSRNVIGPGSKQSEAGRNQRAKAFPVIAPLLAPLSEHNQTSQWRPPLLSLRAVMPGAVRLLDVFR